jgi:sRNA-binding regulator protein Hfq
MSNNKPIKFDATGLGGDMKPPKTDGNDRLNRVLGRLAAEIVMERPGLALRALDWDDRKRIRPRAPMVRETAMQIVIHSAIDAFEAEHDRTPSRVEVFAYLLGGKDATGLVVRVEKYDVVLSDNQRITKAYLRRHYGRYFLTE